MSTCNQTTKQTRIAAQHTQVHNNSICKKIILMGVNFQTEMNEDFNQKFCCPEVHNTNITTKMINSLIVYRNLCDST